MVGILDKQIFVKNFDSDSRYERYFFHFQFNMCMHCHRHILGDRFLDIFWHSIRAGKKCLICWETKFKQAIISHILGLLCVFYVQKGKISLQYPSKYQHFPAVSFPNSTFFPSVHSMDEDGGEGGGQWQL